MVGWVQSEEHIGGQMVSSQQPGSRDGEQGMGQGNVHPLRPPLPCPTAAQEPLRAMGPRLPVAGKVVSSAPNTGVITVPKS